MKPLGGRGILRKLALIPARYVALAYLLAIPLFALLYYVLPDSFYHSTVQYEDSMITDTKEVQNGLLNELNRGLQATLILESSIPNLRGTITETLDGGSLEISAVDNLTAHGEYLHFEIHGSIIRHSENLAMDGWEEWIVEAEITPYPAQNWQRFREGVRVAQWDVRIISVHYGDYAYGTIIDIGEPKLTLAEVVFPEDMPYFGSSEMRALTLPTSLGDKMVQVWRGLRGFPVSVKANLGRMLYLSAVTITTLGYGDILPLTDFARILVGSEAVLGVILPGLFLNSLFQQLTKKPKIYRIRRRKP